MRIYLSTRHEPPCLTDLHVLPPLDQLGAVLETARADAQPVQHRRGFSIVCYSSSCAVFAARLVGGVVVRLGLVAVAQHLFAVVRRVPGPEADVPQHDFIDVAV